PKERVGRGVIHRALAVAQLGEEVLAGVGQALEPGERQEAARALDRVDDPEDAREQLTGPRRALERHEVRVELIEVLVALDQELPDDLVHAIHNALHGTGPADASPSARVRAL